MPNYRRARNGNVFFFTLVSLNREPILCHAFVRNLLRQTIREARARWPFVIEAWVLLPDHMHFIWSLPDTDNDYSKRIGWTKKEMSRRFRDLAGTARPTIWQKRFWEHRIRNEQDYSNHCDYIHYNPLKHGLCDSPLEWPFSTVHRFVRDGLYPRDWASSGFRLPEDVGRE